MLFLLYFGSRAIGVLGDTNLPNLNPIDPHAHFKTGALASQHKNSLYDHIETGAYANVTYAQIRKMNVHTLKYQMDDITDSIHESVNISASYITLASELCKKTIKPVQPSEASYQRSKK